LQEKKDEEKVDGIRLKADIFRQRYMLRNNNVMKSDGKLT
jgi:hypothetical protein